MSADGKWSCTVPMMLVPPDGASPDDCLELARRMRADRVLLIGPDQHAPGMPDVEHFRQLADLLRERIGLFAACDISVAFWMWRTIGHSGAFSTGGARPLLQQIVGYRGQQAADCYCPLDANFVGYICEALAATLPKERRPPPLMMALHIWSLSHGIAALFGRGDGARRPIPMSPEDLLEAAVLIYLDGLGVSPDQGS